MSEDNDIKRKIGKRGLGSLLATEDEEEKPRRRGHTGPHYDDEYGDYTLYGGDYPYSYPTRGRDSRRSPGARSAFGHNTAHLGRPVGSRSQPPFEIIDDEYGMFGEDQLRRIATEIGEDLRIALKRHRMHVRFGKERLLLDLIEELLVCGDVRVRDDATGRYYTVVVDDA